MLMVIFMCNALSVFEARMLMPNAPYCGVVSSTRSATNSELLRKTKKLRLGSSVAAQIMG